MEPNKQSSSPADDAVVRNSEQTTETITSVEGAGGAGEESSERRSDTTSSAAPTTAFGLVQWGVQQALSSGSLVGWSLLMSVVGALLFFVGIGGGALTGMAVNASLGVIVGLIGFAGGMIVLLMNALALLFAIADPERLSYWAAWRKGWSQIWSYLVLSLAGSLIMVTGFVFLIIPGLILAVYFVLAQIVFVREGKTGVAAYARSLELVKGAWWGTLGRGALFMIGVMIVTSVIAIVFGFFGSAGEMLAQLVQYIVQAVVTVAAVFMINAWYEQRVVVNGVSTEPAPATSWLRVMMWFGVVLMVLAPVMVGTYAISKFNDVAGPMYNMTEMMNDDAELKAEFEAMMEAELGEYIIEETE